jgi:hypothetical protein
MSDLLTLLDQAIDELASDVSSRCSRSQAHGEGLTGAPTLLETKTVPAVPVVPGEKSEMHGSDARMRGDTCHNSSSTTRVAHTSTIQNRAGTAGTTGTDPENQRLTVPKTSLEIGNDGNDSKLPPPWFFLTVICELHCRGPLAGPMLPRCPRGDASVPVAREGGGGGSARRPKAGVARSAIRPIICPQSQ